MGLAYREILYLYLKLLSSAHHSLAQLNNIGGGASLPAFEGSKVYSVGAYLLQLFSSLSCFFPCCIFTKSCYLSICTYLHAFALPKPSPHRTRFPPTADLTIGRAARHFSVSWCEYVAYSSIRTEGQRRAQHVVSKSRVCGWLRTRTTREQCHLCTQDELQSSLRLAAPVGQEVQWYFSGSF